MNCKETTQFKSPFSIVAHNAKGLIGHFTPDCRCWACDHCRPKNIEKHAKRAKSLFLDTIWHVAVSLDQWDAFYAKARRSAPEVQYMRITLGSLCHVFADHYIPDSEQHLPDRALSIAQARLLEIKDGGTHVSYSTGWLPLPCEKPLHRWVRIALCIPRHILDSVARVVQATVTEVIGATFLGGYSIPLAEVVALIAPFDRRRPSIRPKNAADRPIPTRQPPPSQVPVLCSV